MGKPSPPAYRDDPTLSDAVSLHTTRGEFDDDAPELDGLPAYSDEAPQAARDTTTPDSDMTVVGSEKFSTYRNDVKIVQNPRYDTDPVFLERYVKTGAYEPPRPTIRIRGTHTRTVKKEKNKTEKEEVVDFDLVIHLGKWLSAEPTWLYVATVENHEKTYRGTILKKRAPGHKADVEENRVKPTLKEWCHRYCASHARLKTYVSTDS